MRSCLIRFGSRSLPQGQFAPVSLSIATAVVVLAFGLALETGPVGAVAGQAVSHAIAALAEPMLGLSGLDLVRNGTELRSVSAGWAVRVSEVCDGMGLIVALLATLLALAPGRGSATWVIRRAALGVAAVQIFNLIRVVALTLALDRWPGGFALLHDRLFPMLTVLVIGVVLLPATWLLAFAALTVGLALLWAPIAGTVSALLVPIANALLPQGLVEMGEIALRNGTWSVGTMFLAGTDPVRLFLAPLEPQHFTLSMPVIAAAALLARRPLWLVFALPLMLAALVVAAPVTVWALAAAEAPVTLLRSDGAGAFVPEAYAPPEVIRAILRLVQNSLVHFLLLVLPFLALSNAGGQRGRC